MGVVLQTLYDILDIAQSATAEEIKAAYRRLAMKWHPDRNLNNREEAEERFKELGYAYKVLSDPKQRAEYDDYLASQQSAGTQKQREPESAYGKGMSEDDAAKMFYDQMLDLAYELARRGFDEAKIVKTLLALDCPEIIAKAVANTASRGARRHESTPNDSFHANQHSDSSKVPDSLESASWSAVAPYYSAVIGGVHADLRMDDDEYQRTVDESKKGMIGYAVAFALMFLGALLLAKGVLGWWIVGVGAVLFIATIVWRIVKGGGTEFRREKTMRYYLSAFESYHNARPLPFRFQSLNLGGWFGSIFWIAYRRMPISSLVGVIIVAAITSILTVIEIDNPELGKAFNMSGYIWGAIVGSVANRIYFNSARRKINKVLALPKEHALLRLRNEGGTNGWSWIAYLILFFVLLLPVIGYQSQVEEQRAAAIAAQKQAEAEAREKAAAEARAQAAAVAEREQRRRLDVVIAEMEARHPEFNEKDPRFNQNLTNEALARMKAYINQGIEPASALRMAVADMEREATGSRPVSR